MRIFLHIGLHKTATTYLQQAVFPRLEAGRIEYNPADISSRMRDVFRLRGATGMLGEYRERCREEAMDLLDRRRSSPGARDLLLSHEGFSQFEFVQNYDENADLLHSIVPEAEIVLFLRFQPEWLLSLYRQSVSVGEHQPVASFLNFRDGEFRPTREPYNDEGLLHMNALGADWGHLIDCYARRYGARNVHVYFFEDFRDDAARTVGELCRLMGVSYPQVSSNIVNRGVSGRTAQWLIRRRRLYNAAGLGMMLHTVKKERQRYADKLMAKLLSECPDRSPAAAARYQIARLRRRPKLLTFTPLLQRYLEKGWRRDRDLLVEHGMREKLEACYRSRNRSLLDHMAPDRIPAGYME